MPILDTRFSQSAEEHIGSLRTVTVQPAMEIDRDECVVVKVCGTGEDSLVVCGSSGTAVVGKCVRVSMIMLSGVDVIDL
jgi:hypothetical protein